VNIAEWESHLGQALTKSVCVKFGRARTQPVKAAFEHDRVELRLHEFFGEAPSEVADDLAAWLRAGGRARRASARLDAWIDERLASLPPRVTRRQAIDLRGQCHDLEPMVQRLFDSEFQFERSPDVTWGRRGRSRARRSLQLGCYVRSAHLVRMNRVLDQPGVPAWFVNFVLFHELIHAALPVTVQAHGREFRTWERSHPDYRAAVDWQRTNLDRLIRSARTGSLLR
jgi:hypothetical protein